MKFIDNAHRIVDTGISVTTTCYSRKMNNQMGYSTQDIESMSFIRRESWRETSANGLNTGVFSGTSYYYQGLSCVYSYEMHSGGPIASNWCLNSEVKFSEAMALAASIKWEDELQDLIAIL